MTQSKIKEFSIVILGKYKPKAIYSSYIWQNHRQLYKIIEAQYSNVESLSQTCLSPTGSTICGYKLSERDSREFVHQLEPNNNCSTSNIVLVVQDKIDISAETRFCFCYCTFKDRSICQSLSTKDEASDLDNFQPNLANNLRQQELLIKITQQIRRSSSLNIIFDTVTQSLIDILSCERTTIVCMTAKNIAIESQSFEAGFSNLPSLVAADFHSLDFTRTECVAQSDRYSISVPILLEQVIKPIPHYPLWGWLRIEGGYLHQWNRSQQVFLEQLSIQLGIALSQKLLYQQLQNIDRQLQAVKISNQHFKKLSHRDSLTQVYNRRYFKQQLDREWLRLRRSNSYLSVILCDIDYFKLFNDTYGHQQGDVCLRQVAETLSKTLKRAADIVARYGGEEFAIVMPDTDELGAARVAETIRTAVKDLRIPHSSSPSSSMVTLSSGVATTIPHDKYTPKMLLEAADDALYLAKNRGRDTVAVYEHSIALSNYQQNHNREWVQRIRYALENDLFQLYAQPIESLKGKDKRHFEILLRLEDRAGEILAPSCFFEIAERNCLMSSIDTWVISKLLSELTTKCCSTNCDSHQFSVNLSGASLNDRHFLDFLSDRLKKHCLSPQLFCFEITEAIAVDNIQNIRDFMTALKTLGCQFALDDFGKGMCSLTYLKNFPIDYLKIDGSFILDLHQNKTSLVMVEAIKHMATGIGLKTVAEYVENQEILDILQRLDIDYAQGYHLGRPRRLAEIV